MTRKIAIVEWEDTQVAKGELSNWMDKDQFDEWCQKGIPVCSSVGYLTFEDNEIIVISQTLFGDDRAENTMIPRVNIVKMAIVYEDDFDGRGWNMCETFSEIQKLLTHAIATMDDSGRRNPEGNSYMLWEAYWDELRLDIFKVKKLTRGLGGCHMAQTPKWEQPPSGIASEIAGKFYPVASLQHADLRRQIIKAIEAEREVARHYMTQMGRHWEKSQFAKGRRK